MHRLNPIFSDCQPKRNGDSKYHNDTNEFTFADSDCDTDCDGDLYYDWNFHLLIYKNSHRFGVINADKHGYGQFHANRHFYHNPFGHPHSNVERHANGLTNDNADCDATSNSDLSWRGESHEWSGG